MYEYVFFYSPAQKFEKNGHMDKARLWDEDCVSYDDS